MELRIATITSILLMILVTIKTVTALQCFECKSDPDCASHEECIESCNKAQTIANCKDDEVEHVCINISFSYLEGGKTRYKYKRECWVDLVDHWGCDYNCLAARHFNSTDCKANCCKDDLCNSNNPTVLRFTGSSISHSHQTRTPRNKLIVFLMSAVILLITGVLNS